MLETETETETEPTAYYYALVLGTVVLGGATTQLTSLCAFVNWTRTGLELAQSPPSAALAFDLWMMLRWLATCVQPLLGLVEQIAPPLPMVSDKEPNGEWEW